MQDVDDLYKRNCGSGRVLLVYHQFFEQNGQDRGNYNFLSLSLHLK